MIMVISLERRRIDLHCLSSGKSEVVVFPVHVAGAHLREASSMGSFHLREFVVSSLAATCSAQSASHSEVSCVMVTRRALRQPRVSLTWPPLGPNVTIITPHAMNRSSPLLARPQPTWRLVNKPAEVGVMFLSARRPFGWPEWKWRLESSPTNKATATFGPKRAPNTGTSAAVVVFAAARGNQKK